MRILGTIIVFLIGVMVGITLYATANLGYLPESVSSYWSEPTYQSPTYDTASGTGQTYPTNQDQSSSQYSSASNQNGQSYNTDPMRLVVRCNVEPQDMPYGCGAAYTLVNRTQRSLYVTFEGGDTQVERANTPMTIAPGQSVGGNEELRKNYPNNDANGDDLSATPPFVIEIQDCNGACANY